MILFRPVGVKELELIAGLGFKAFPPRLEIQPIFYPVLNFDYAAQIARDWNTKDPVSGYAGFVTRFEIDDEYAAKFEVQTVGTRGRHDELWVLAEELEAFNSHLTGPIEVIASFIGERFDGEIDTKTNLPIHLKLNA
ncbi:ADP-ribosylation/crystallin J1 [bacterium]|nr:MAG: ADP-ribosylation/crystallin J1 [bacterium]